MIIYLITTVVGRHNIDSSFIKKRLYLIVKVKKYYMGMLFIYLEREIFNY